MLACLDAIIELAQVRSEQKEAFRSDGEIAITICDSVVGLSGGAELSFDWDDVTVLLDSPTAHKALAAAQAQAATANQNAVQASKRACDLRITVEAKAAIAAEAAEVQAQAAAPATAPSVHSGSCVLIL